jgi:hypothetical protein
MECIARPNNMLGIPIVRKTETSMGSEKMAPTDVLKLPQRIHVSFMAEKKDNKVNSAKRSL